MPSDRIEPLIDSVREVMAAAEWWVATRPSDYRADEESMRLGLAVKAWRLAGRPGVDDD